MSKLVLKLLLLIFLSLPVNLSFAETKYIDCKIKGCDSQWPITAVNLITNHKNDKNLLIWLPGGPGVRLNDVSMDGFEKYKNLLIVANPYIIEKSDSNGPVPQAYSSDQTARILSVVNWAISNGYRIWIGGISNGAVRIIGFLNQYPDIHSKIQGVILSATHVCNGSMKCVFLKKWDVNTLVIFHEGDQFFNTRSEIQKDLFKRIKKINSKNTLSIGMEVTRGPKSEKETKRGHHMYEYDRNDYHINLNNFIKGTN
jgi:hypothetical protein